MTPAMVKARIARGSLTRLRRSVHVVGHRRLTPRGHALAAVLAAGPGAALSHRGAAWLHESGPLPRGRWDVTAPLPGPAKATRSTRSGRPSGSRSNSTAGPWHGHRQAFQRDREKGTALAEAGWTVLRFTCRDVTQRPEAVASQLRRVLGADEARETGR